MSKYSIVAQTVYKCNGLEFNSMPRALEYLEDGLGSQVDKIQPKVILSAGQKLSIHAWLLSNRKELVELLTAYDTFKKD